MIGLCMKLWRAICILMSNHIQFLTVEYYYVISTGAQGPACPETVYEVFHYGLLFSVRGTAGRRVQCRVDLAACVDASETTCEPRR